MEPCAILVGAAVSVPVARHALAESFAKDGGDCVLLPRCWLRQQPAAARESFFAELDRSTLADCVYTPDDVMGPA